MISHLDDEGTSVNDDLLLDVAGLKTHFFGDDGVIKAVDGVDLQIRPGTTLCVVGESGCGKSITARSILQLIEPPGRIVAGAIRFSEGGEANQRELIDLAALNPYGREMRAIRGRQIAMIFQEPMASLSQVHTIGDTIVEAIQEHEPVARAVARARAIELLGQVGIPKPEQRIDAYPFQLSGGMRQRAMIAIALSCNPRLLIADEPTTALDVTTQAQILELLRNLQRQYGMAIMLITHDLGVVAEMADDVVVMYLGHVVERGDVDTIFSAPRHPYTQALLQSLPRIGRKTRERLAAIRGMVPDPFHRPTGCPFHTRCNKVIVGVCESVVPQPVQFAGGQEVRCLLYQKPMEQTYEQPVGA
jgi:oligopeptide/dipeptide ABC transporter ATP-binding protein